MILGVNGLRLLGKRSGVGRCIEALLHEIPRLDHPFREIRLYTPAPIPDCFPPLVRAIVLPSSAPSAWWEQHTLRRAHGRRDPLLCPSYVVPLLATCPTLVIHHGSYEGYPQAHGWWVRNKARAIYSASAWRATMVSTVSEHSKRDIVRFYRIPASKISVVPDGVDVALFRPIDSAEQLGSWRRRVLGADVPLLLYVGKASTRRSLPELLEAFSRLKRERRIPHKLALIGTDMPGIDLRPFVERLGLRTEVVLVGHSTQEELALAYNAADIFIYASSYEGFGMPVLEAMSCGTPVLALDKTAIPEFAGGVASLLPDGRPETLRRGIEDLLDDPARRALMRRLGPERAAHYTWTIVASRYLDLLRQLATHAGSA